MPILKENKDRYPKDWELRSKFVRFIRGKGKCEWCGVEHKSIRDGVEIILQTAHVYDKNPENASLLNLAALCARCHNKHDAKDRRENYRSRIERSRAEKEFWFKAQKAEQGKLFG